MILENLTLPKTDNAKNRQNFANSTCPKLCYKMKENLLNEKDKLENLLAENQTQTKLEKTPPLKIEFGFMNSTIKRTL